MFPSGWSFLPSPGSTGSSSRSWRRLDETSSPGIAAQSMSGSGGVRGRGGCHGGRPKVDSFEANLDLVGRLEPVFRQRDHPPGGAQRPAAARPSSGCPRVGQGTEGRGSLEGPGPSRGRMEAPCRRHWSLDDFGLGDVGFLKIDVEGHELPVFGARPDCSSASGRRCWWRSSCARTGRHRSTTSSSSSTTAPIGGNSCTAGRGTRSANWTVVDRGHGGAGGQARLRHQPPPVQPPVRPQFRLQAVLSSCGKSDPAQLAPRSGGVRNSLARFVASGSGFDGRRAVSATHWNPADLSPRTSTPRTSNVRPQRRCSSAVSSERRHHRVHAGAECRDGCHRLGDPIGRPTWIGDGELRDSGGVQLGREIVVSPCSHPVTVLDQFRAAHNRAPRWSADR